MSKLIIVHITCDEVDVENIREVLEEDVKAIAEHVSITVEDVQA